MERRNFLKRMAAASSLMAGAISADSEALASEGPARADQAATPEELPERWVNPAPFPHLEGTAPLTLPTDYPPGWACRECTAQHDHRPILAWQYQQIWEFFLKKIAATPAERDQRWRDVDFSSVRGYAASIQKHRERLRQMLGLYDLKTIDTDRVVLQTGPLEIEDITLWLTPYFAARALVFTPQGKVSGTVIAIPPATEAREDFAGMVGTEVTPNYLHPSAENFQRGLTGMVEGESAPNWLQSLLDRRLSVAVPMTVERKLDHPECQVANKDRRLLLQLLGFIVGRSTVGLEVQQVLALQDFLAERWDASGEPIELLGFGQGGMTALFAAAVEERFAGATVVNYFQPREESWREPVDRMLYGQLNEFGDAELAALVAPRLLSIVYTAGGPTPAEKVQKEAQRAGRFYGGLGQEKKLVVQPAKDRAAALEWAAREIGARVGQRERAGTFPIIVWVSRQQVDQARNQHFELLLKYLRRLDREADGERQAYWGLLKTPPSQRDAKAAEMRKELAGLMGTVADEGRALNARTKLIRVTDNYAIYEVLLDVVEGVEAYGQLLVPRKGQGPFPAIICQHGLSGSPRDITGSEVPVWADTPLYHKFAAHLADMSYVTFAPYVTVPWKVDPAEGQLIDPLVEMAASTGMMRTSIELAKLRRIIDFLQSLPFVSGERIGYYGLSYGGYDSLWMPPLEPRIKATVTTGFFNDQRMFLERYVDNFLDLDFYNWHVLHRFSHVELIAARWPRAACVEYGIFDGVCPHESHLRAWEQVAAFAKAWGVPDRYVRSHFNGRHEMHGIGSSDFLARWLRPEQPAQRDYAYAAWMQAAPEAKIPDSSLGGCMQYLDADCVEISKWPYIPYITHELDAVRGRQVGGTFYVSSSRSIFSGMAIRVSRVGNPGDLLVRFGSSQGADDVGVGRIAARRVPTSGAEWVRLTIAARSLDPTRLYFFHIGTESGWGPDDHYVLYGPRPWGGRDFPENFGVSYRVLTTGE